MKKKLEAELISIAHRILKLKNKSDLIQLHQETQKLYEKLSVLRFVEEHLGDVKPTIGRSEIEEKITAAFDTSVSELAEQTVADEINAEETPKNQDKIETPKAQEPQPSVSAEEESQPDEMVAETSETPQEPSKEIGMDSADANPEKVEEPETDEEQPEEPVQEPGEKKPEDKEPEQQPVGEYDTPAEIAWESSATESTSETKNEATQTAHSFKPAFELSFDAKDEKEEEVKEDAKDQFKNVNSQITFEDILGSTYVDPVFVKPEDLARERETSQPDNVIPIGRNFSDAPVISLNKTDGDRSFSLNDRVSKGITIGLNDRVAFMKHLFNNSSEDYNRVLSQLITFDTFDEAKSFIDNMVKPDYNNWDGKDEYAERFMEIVEKKFS